MPNMDNIAQLHHYSQFGRDCGFATCLERRVGLIALSAKMFGLTTLYSSVCWRWAKPIPNALKTHCEK